MMGESWKKGSKPWFFQPPPQRKYSGHFTRPVKHCWQIQTAISRTSLVGTPRSFDPGPVTWMLPSGR